MKAQMQPYKKMLNTFKEQLISNSNKTYNTLEKTCNLITKCANDKFDLIIYIEDEYSLRKTINKKETINQITQVINSLDIIYNDLEILKEVQNYSDDYNDIISKTKQEILEVRSDSCVILKRISSSKTK